MIRREDDLGVMYLLDPRIVLKSYGKTLQKALPKNVKIKIEEISETITQTSDFLL
jgi:ATP-dependent DNA helicase DinG